MLILFLHSIRKRTFVTEGDVYNIKQKKKKRYHVL